MTFSSSVEVLISSPFARPVEKEATNREWGSDYRKSYKLTTTHVWQAKHASKQDTEEDEFEALSA